MSDRKSEIGNRKSGREVAEIQRVEAPRYQQLDAWRYADDLAVDIYRVTKSLAPDLRPVTSQILRAAISVPANIAEGYGRGSDKEFLQFLTIAHSSLYEVSSFVHFLQRIEAITPGTYERLAAACSRGSRVIFGLMRSVRTRDSRTTHRRYLPVGGKEVTDGHS